MAKIVTFSRVFPANHPRKGHTNNGIRINALKQS